MGRLRVRGACISALHIGPVGVGDYYRLSSSTQWRRPRPMAEHALPGTKRVAFLVSTIEFVFDGENLSLFLTAQQYTRARSRLVSSSINEADCPENMRPHRPRTPARICRVRRVLGIGNPESGSKSVPDDNLPVPKVASNHAMEVYWAVMSAQLGLQRRPPRIVESSLYVQ
ncbi:hypothetical protein EVAR_103592_1 [Eumeta japonica]|uniref:Uncharacterized protein n=1 Tax=Eumeta variegata TaxID=151549 RepID=A0A4C1ZAZ2_EUMVA|nr:hypothetical protein EVAR_103592_1 [Eumeta japonica]